MNALALVKDDGQRYVFTYDDDPRSYVALLEQLGHFASNPDLDFTWYDAAVCSQRLRQYWNGRR